MVSETSCIFAAKLAQKIWNDYLATPYNGGKQMQFSYQNLKDDITNILTTDTDEHSTAEKTVRRNERHRKG